MDGKNREAITTRLFLKELIVATQRAQSGRGESWELGIFRPGRVGSMRHYIMQGIIGLGSATQQAPWPDTRLDHSPPGSFDGNRKLVQFLAHNS